VLRRNLVDVMALAGATENHQSGYQREAGSAKKKSHKVRHISAGHRGAQGGRCWIRFLLVLVLVLVLVRVLLLFLLLVLVLVIVIVLVLVLVIERDKQNRARAGARLRLRAIAN
jgi:Flp pilus assembly protein TadB